MDQTRRCRRRVRGLIKMATAKKKAILFGAMESLKQNGVNDREAQMLLMILGQKKRDVSEAVTLQKAVNCYQQELLSTTKSAAA